MSKLGSGIGSALGGAAGTFLGPLGTGLGSAVGGALGGLFGGGDPEAPASPYTADDALAANHNSQLSIEQQQAFLSQLAQQNGAANQQAVFNQLQQVANGQGPNPAQAMLANQTGQNVAQQAALMAGQRGAGANAGLIARQAAMQGANTQQQAIGQGAALQAQQSLGALNSLGGIAGQQVGQQQNALSGLGAQSQGQQQMINNSIAGANSNATSMNLQDAKFGQSVLGGALGGVGSAIQTGISPGASTPGQVVGQAPGVTAANPSAPDSANNPYGMQMKAQGGMVGASQPSAPSLPQPPIQIPQASGPQSMIGRHQAGGFNHMPTMMAQGGQVPQQQQGRPVPIIVSPGEKVLSKADAQAVKAGTKSPMSIPTVPGQAKVAGDSKANDNVPITAEEGGCVIPRSILMSKNPHEAAAKFVREHMKKMSKK